MPGQACSRGIASSPELAAHSPDVHFRGKGVRVLWEINGMGKEKAGRLREPVDYLTASMIKITSSAGQGLDA